MEQYILRSEVSFKTIEKGKHVAVNTYITFSKGSRFRLLDISITNRVKLEGLSLPGYKIDLDLELFNLVFDKVSY